MAIKHKISSNEHTIYVTIVDELNISDAKKISDQAIELAKKSPHPLNLMLIVFDGYAQGARPIIEACAKLAPHIDKFQSCYLVGDSDKNFRYAITFFRTLGGSNDRAFFFEMMEKAEADIAKRWKKFKKN